MKFAKSLTFLGSLAAVSAAESICDTYTAALLGANTAANQEMLLTLVVNTAAIGNYSGPNKYNVNVPGLLNPGVYDGTKVNLLPYFDATLASSNNGGKCGVAVNWLDGGGATPLMQNKPADSKTSNQYGLLTHLYQFFASLLGCSEFGNTIMPYAGQKSLYEVHKFMALSYPEFGWFVENVGLSAASFGVAKSDVDAVGAALFDLFGYRCEAPEEIPPVPEEKLQSICIDCDCPLAKNAVCADYAPVIQPQPASSSSSWCGSEEWHQSQCWCENEGGYGGPGGGWGW